VVSLVDGQLTGKRNPDLFRFLLWDSNGNIVFDNEPGVQPYKKTSEAIAHGSIVFHREKSCEEKNLKSLSLSDKSEPVSNNMNDMVKVYPNPVDNLLFIDLPRLEDEDLTYSLTDISGKITIAQSKLEPISQLGWIDLQPFSLTPGVYLLKIHGNKQLKTRAFRLIKQ